MQTNTHPRKRPVPSTLASKATSAERELAWYFGVAASDMGVRSNMAANLAVALTGVVGRLGSVEDDDLERRVMAATAARAIERRLGRLRPGRAGVLEAAYQAVAWPESLTRRLHTLTGVAVRLWARECDRAIVPGHERRMGFLMAACVRDPRELALLGEEAEGIYRESLAGYEAARGDAACAVPRYDADGPSPSREVYSVAELAKVALVTTSRMRRLLVAFDVEMVKDAGEYVVPVDEVRDKVPPLFRSLVKAEQTRRTSVAARRALRVVRTVEKNDTNGGPDVDCSVLAFTKGPPETLK
jgi:hypothetical protein